MGKNRRRFKQEIILDIIHTLNQFKKVRMIMISPDIHDHDSLGVTINVNPEDMRNEELLKTLDVAMAEIENKFPDVNFIFKTATHSLGKDWPHRESMCMFVNSFSDYRK